MKIYKITFLNFKENRKLSPTTFRNFIKTIQLFNLLIFSFNILFAQFPCERVTGGNVTEVGSITSWSQSSSSQWQYDATRGVFNQPFAAGTADDSLFQQISNLPSSSFTLSFDMLSHRHDAKAGFTADLWIYLNGVEYANFKNTTANQNGTITLSNGATCNLVDFNDNNWNGAPNEVELTIPYSGPSTANLVFKMTAPRTSVNCGFLCTSWGADYFALNNISILGKQSDPENITCNTSGTIVDPSDDFIGFDLNPTPGTGNYSIVSSSGTITPSSGTFGATTTFELASGTVGASDVTITMTDLTDNCVFTAVIVDPGSCLDYCGSTIDINMVAEKANVIVTTTTTISGPIGNLADGNNAGNNFFFEDNNTSIAGDVMLQYEFLDEISIKGFEVVTSGRFIVAGSELIVQGSNNNSTWTDIENITVPSPEISAAQWGGTGNVMSFPFLNNTEAYKYYRLLAVSGNTDRFYWVYETYFNYVYTPFDLLNEDCNLNNTTVDLDDDYIGFDLNPTTNTAGNYFVSVDNGTITPTSGTFGSATSFQLQDGSAGTGDVVLEMIDEGNVCRLKKTITDPECCLSNCGNLVANGDFTDIAAANISWNAGGSWNINNGFISHDVVATDHIFSQTISGLGSTSFVVSIDISGQNNAISTGYTGMIDLRIGTNTYATFENTAAAPHGPTNGVITLSNGATSTNTSFNIGSGNGTYTTVEITIPWTGPSTADLQLVANGTGDDWFLRNIIINKGSQALASTSFTNKICNDNGTEEDGTDDFMTFDFNPAGTGTYNVVSEGIDITPTTGQFGQTTTFTVDMTSASRGSYDISFIDVTGECKVTKQIYNRGDCLPFFPSYEVEATVVTCNNAMSNDDASLKLNAFNIAKPDSAYASSIGFGGNPMRAVDGNTNGNWNAGSVAHTGQDNTTEWLEIQLSDWTDIREVVVWNRTDAANQTQHRLVNCYLMISDSPFPNNYDVNESLNQSSFTYQFPANTNQSSFTIPVDTVFGRYVRIQKSGNNGTGVEPNYMNIAEIVVNTICDPKVDYMAGGSFNDPTKTFATATVVGTTFPIDLETGIANPEYDQPYTVRMYCGVDNYKDTTVVIKRQECSIADLQVSINHPQQTANIGEFVSYDVELENLGPHMALDVEIIVDVPLNADFATAVPTLGSYSNADQLWKFDQLPVGTQTLTITYKVK